MNLQLLSKSELIAKLQDANKTIEKLQTIIDFFPESELLTNKFFPFNSDFIIKIDTNGTITDYYLNKEVNSKFDFNNLRNSNISQYLLYEDSKKLLLQVHQAISQKQTKKISLQVRHNDQPSTTLLVHITPLSNDSALCICSNTTRESKIISQLSQQEEIYRNIINKSPLPTLLIDRSFKVQFFNEALLDFLPEKHKNLTGKHIRKFLRHEDKIMLLEFAKKAISNPNQTFVSETFSIFEHSCSINITSCLNIKSINGLLIFINILTKNISSSNDENFANLLWKHSANNAKEPLFIIDYDFNIISYNKAFTNIVDMPPEQILNRKCFHIMHDSDTPPHFCPAQLAQKSLRTEDAQFFDQKQQKHFAHSATPLHDHNGNIISFSASITDNTKEQLLLEKLNSYKNMLKKTFSSIPLPICIIKKFKFAWINNSFSLLTGFSASELINRSPYILFHSSAQFNSALKYIRSQQHFNAFEISLRKKNHSSADVLLFSTNYFNPEHDREHLFTLIDISQKNEKLLNANTSISKLRTQLYQKNIKYREALEEYTLNLHQKNLAQNQLIETNHAKDKLFSIIAHDLKTPMQILLSSSELLKQHFQFKHFDKVDKHIDRVQLYTLKMRDLLNNLLTWSRSQSGKISHNPDIININELAKECSNIFLEQAEKKIISLNVKADTNHHALADKNMTSTVLRNLINNAIKFTPANGNVTITISEDSPFVKISVSDDGIGISEENIKKLFRNDTLHSTPGTDHEKGTGLGLLICKEFVDKNNGKIWVESSLHSGTIFSFTLPKVKV